MRIFFHLQRNSKGNFKLYETSTMGANMSNLPGGPPKDKDKKTEKKKWEPPVATRVGKKKKKGPDSASKLPPGVSLRHSLRFMACANGLTVDVVYCFVLFCDVVYCCLLLCDVW